MENCQTVKPPWRGCDVTASLFASAGPAPLCSAGFAGHWLRSAHLAFPRPGYLGPNTSRLSNFEPDPFRSALLPLPPLLPIRLVNPSQHSPFRQRRSQRGAIGDDGTGYGQKKNTSWGEKCGKLEFVLIPIVSPSLCTPELESERIRVLCNCSGMAPRKPLSRLIHLISGSEFFRII
jgi:hypothetical protein